MIKVPVTIYPDLERVRGQNDRGPYDFQKQAAQVNLGNGRAMPFDIFVDKETGPLAAGNYAGVLTPKLGRFNGNIDWVFSEFIPLTDKS